MNDGTHRSSGPPAPVAHRRIEIDGIDVFYREAGPVDGPVVLLPHGYPCSSFQYRHFMAALGDRWRLIAPDLPGFGYSATPDPARFSYSFAGYGAFLGRFVEQLDLPRYAIYLHDYGSQHGFRLAMSAPERVAALIIQNGDIYEDALGPKYEWLKSTGPTRRPRAATRWPATSARRASATSSWASYPRVCSSASARTCGRCTGR
jgi:pimeloyl-ACP methyl ester carboxylesterase